MADKLDFELRLKNKARAAFNEISGPSSGERIKGERAQGKLDRPELKLRPKDPGLRRAAELAAATPMTRKATGHEGLDGKTPKTQFRRPTDDFNRRR